MTCDLRPLCSLEIPNRPDGLVSGAGQQLQPVVVAAGVDGDGAIADRVGERGCRCGEQIGGCVELQAGELRSGQDLTVRDWRKNARVANIETDELADMTKVKALLKLMIDASEALPISGEDANAGGGRRVWYVSKSVRSALRWGILEKVSANLTWGDWYGKRVMMMDDIPVRRLDAILETESVVPFS